MKHGTRPTKNSHKDYDWHRTYGTVAPLVFPDTYLCDAGLTMPNQNALDTEFTPPVPPEPEGCTNFAQADLATDLTGKIHSPADLEAVTHANALGGYDIRKSLMATKSFGWITVFFNITLHPSQALDYFDTLRLAQISGIPEKRSITFGTPWYPSWEQWAKQGQSILQMPTPGELAAIARNNEAFPWHDSKLDGWLMKNGNLVYRDKSWQGRGVGDGGFLYFPREVINYLSTINGVAAFTATTGEAPPIQTVSLSISEWFWSHWRSLIGLDY